MTLPGYPANWPAPAGVRAWQTTRAGGVSEGPYASLNLGMHVGDRDGDVLRNRERLRSSLALPAEPVWLEQVHGTRILDVDAGETGAADGAVTRTPGVVLAIMTADCLPVLLASDDGEVVGAAHAGWRGLASGVLENAVAALRREPAAVTAWLGPAISRPAFEVGDEVRDAFLDHDAAAVDAFVANDNGRWQADLHALARLRLAAAGVASIHGDSACTRSDSRRFFSHRREAPCGRMATLIWRERR